MGMFDDLRCKYPLPVKGANALAYQTKDTPAQYLDNYEIREDGTLWHEAYETRMEETKAAPLGFYLHRDNKRWEPEEMTGELRFYTTLPPNHSGWIEWSAYFEAGKIARLNLIEHRNADAPNIRSQTHPTEPDKTL